MALKSWQNDKIGTKVLMLALFVGAVLCSFDLAVFGETTPEKDPALTALQQSAKTYWKNNQYDQARQVYSDIIAAFPDTPGAVYAQKYIATSYIKEGNGAAASAAIDKLIADYTSHQSFARAMSVIAALYKDKGNYQKASETYQYIIDNCPDNSGKARACTGLAVMSIKNKNYATADAAANELLTGFGNYDVSENLKKVVNQYSKAGDFAEALQLCQTGLTTWADSDRAIKCQSDIALLNLQTNDLAGMQTATDQLVSNFADNQQLASELEKIARKCVDRKYYAEARDIYNKIVQNCPSSPLVSVARINAEKMNIRLLIYRTEYNNARIAIEKLVDDFSGDPALPSVIEELACKSKTLRSLPWMKEIFQNITDNYSNDDFAAKAGMEAKRLALFELISSRSDSATIDSGINELISTYSGHKDLPEALSAIADRYANLGDTNRAKVIHDRILQIDYEQSQDATIKVERYSIGSLIEIGETQEARDAIDQLCQNYSQERYLPKLLESFARKFEEKGNYSDCRNIYQQIVDNCPDSPGSIWPRMAIDVLDVELAGSDPNTAILAVEAKLETYAGHPYLPRAVFWAGEYYYKNAFKKENEGKKALANNYFQNALRLLERVKQFADPSPPWVAPETRVAIAECYRKIGRYDKAIESYQEMVAGWPSNEYAWHAQFNIGECYRQLTESGAMSRTDGIAASKTAYEDLLQNYPDCPSVGIARKRISQLNSKEGAQL